VTFLHCSFYPLNACALVYRWFTESPIQRVCSEYPTEQSRKILFLFTQKRKTPRECGLQIDYDTVLSVVLYTCETWCLTLTEEQRMTVFENKVLRSIMKMKIEEVREVKKKTA